MKKAPKNTGGGAPEWMVTYGDVMGLLLCFFVIIVSMSETKQTKRFEDVAESIRRALGGKRAGIGFTPGKFDPKNTVQSVLPNLVMRKWQLQLGKRAEEGIEGENPSVRNVRDGLEFTFGGQITFEPGKATLLEPGKKQLEAFGELLQGMNTKIKVQGHAATKPPSMYAPFKSLDDLSYARAMAVKEFLVEKGIRKERITVEACGDTEPIRAQAYDEQSRAINRRVSIIVMESLVEDYQGQPPAETGDLTNG